MNEDLKKAISALILAKKMTNERILKFPNYGPYIHARDQIDVIEKLLSQNRLPNQEEKDIIDIALMAIKELDSSEPAYAEALCELSFWFKKL